LHAAKGLEFEAVILAGLEDGTLPYERPWVEQSATEQQEALDEERRLCYVGMTRAKARLILSLARRRIRYGEDGPSYRQMEPSRFLRDLPPELFGEAVARDVRAREAARAAPRPPVIRRHPGALESEPHIELEGASPVRPSSRAASKGEPTVDYSFDQRPGAVRGAFARGQRVWNAALGEGVVLSCDGTGADAKATVRFDAGEKRVLARYLKPAE
jgi:DNA helicase-2/ATP-dependent DNA helicase PcrA